MSRRAVLEMELFKMSFLKVLSCTKMQFGAYKQCKLSSRCFEIPTPDVQMCGRLKWQDGIFVGETVVNTATLCTTGGFKQRAEGPKKEVKAGI